MLGVYDYIAALFEIECQSCRGSFLVGEGWTQYDIFSYPIAKRTLAHMVETFDYGDPPRHGDEMGRCAGETMSSSVVVVVETWQREDFYWERVSVAPPG
jgi:hypothetical protein